MYCSYSLTSPFSPAFLLCKLKGHCLYKLDNSLCDMLLLAPNNLFTNLARQMLQNARRQFHDCMRLQTKAHPPGPHILFQLQDSAITRQKQQIQRESHADSMHGITGNDDQPLIFPELLSSQQPSQT